MHVTQDMQQHPKNVWFVDSGHAAATDGTGYGRNPDEPFATLDYAISHGSVETGDTFFLMPGHAENLGADSAVDVDVSNLQIIGLGWGGCRPTFTCTAVAGDFKLAASCGILENILFINGIDNSTGLLEVSSTDWTVRNCEFREASGAVFADFLITLLDGSDRFHFHDNIVTANAADGSTSAISIVSSDDVHIHDCRFYGNFDTGVIQFITTASARAWIHDCTIWNADDTAGAGGVQMILDTITASTGVIGPNLNLIGVVNAANITEAVTGATFYLIDPVYVINLVNEKAMLIDWTPTTDA
jgi:hypothetical protein